MKIADIKAIAEMLADGMSIAQIADAYAEADAETADAEDFERMAYGEPDDDTSPLDAAYNDRLSMGRNDAGEWLGFM
jgi:hypothetical protein